MQTDRTRDPGKRLLAAAQYVRAGAVFADIGTDHAVLPILLCREGRVKKAYACDVAEAPLEAARRNIARAGLGELAVPLLCDGFSGLDGLGVTDAAVCGMGGELTARLIAAAPFLVRDRVRLILQPMTRARFLRSFLLSSGFSITEEELVSDSGRQYELIVASYTGKREEWSEAELWLGKRNILRGGGELRRLALRRVSHLENLLGGQTPGEREKTEETIRRIRELAGLTERKKHDGS